MKQVSTILLGLLIAFKSFYPLAMYSFYYANQGFYTLFCENKDKPQLQCKGKCYLKKQITKPGKSESTSLVNLKGSETFVFFSEIICQKSSLPVLTRNYASVPGIQYSFIFNNEVIHPPSFS